MSNNKCDWCGKYYERGIRGGVEKYFCSNKCVNEYKASKAEKSAVRQEDKAKSAEIEKEKLRIRREREKEQEIEDKEKKAKWEAKSIELKKLDKPYLAFFTLYQDKLLIALAIIFTTILVLFGSKKIVIGIIFSALILIGIVIIGIKVLKEYFRKDEVI
jgi:uncharacterized membrane protein